MTPLTSHRHTTDWRATPPTVYRAALIAAALAAVMVTTVVGLGTASWIGTTFPGFFILPNRVIASVGRLDWSGTRDSTVYQRTVIDVDGKRIDGNADAYRRVAEHMPGTRLAYTLRHASTVETLTLESRVFSSSDFWVIFGSYLATGLLYLLLGVLGAWLLPDASLGRALLLLGGAGGIFAFTGAGIYTPGADIRIHALAEAFFPATLIYLALVIARAHGRYVTPFVAIAWWVSLALAIPYQLLLDQPGAYSIVHAACETYLGLAGIAAGTTLIVERARAAEDAGPLLRATLAGALLGLGVPAVVMTISGISGGALPVNVTTTTAFLFPLCIGYGLVRERVLVRRPLAAQAV
jgi:hypothetical protein